MPFGKRYSKGEKDALAAAAIVAGFFAWSVWRIRSPGSTGYTPQAPGVPGFTPQQPTAPTGPAGLAPGAGTPPPPQPPPPGVVGGVAGLSPAPPPPPVIVAPIFPGTAGPTGPASLIPTRGALYQIQQGDTLLGVAGQAFNEPAGGVGRRFAAEAINDHPWNRANATYKATEPGTFDAQVFGPERLSFGWPWQVIYIPETY